MTLDSCSIDSRERIQGDGTRRSIEIIPEGCRAVSVDVCKSGYMAPANNVTFPDNSMQQCCKCKEGDSCGECSDPNACTTEEKDKYVTTENCFGNNKESTEESTEESTMDAYNDMLAGRENEGSTEGPTEGSTEKTSYTLYLIVCSVIMSILVGIFFMRRRPQPFY